LVDVDDREQTEIAQEQAAPLFDFDSSDSPIYLQLITIFRRQIALGTWPLNARIPTIENLATQFGVANGTVRQALSFLEREGLIQRMRRRGTYVINLPAQPEPVTLPRTRADFAGMLNGLRAETAPLRSEDVSDLRPVTRTYSRGATTVMIEYERADPALVPEGEIALTGLEKEAFAAMTIDQIVTIGTADTEIALRLNIPVNAAVALIRHRVSDPDGRTVVDCEWLMRGDLLYMVEHYPGPGRST